MDPDLIKFNMKIISNHNSAFEYQIKEAVLINKYSGPLLMNSNSEYNCCTRPKIAIKMGNKQEDDPDIELEKEVISQMKSLYPDCLKIVKL